MWTRIKSIASGVAAGLFVYVVFGSLTGLISFFVAGGGAMYPPSTVDAWLTWIVATPTLLVVITAMAVHAAIAPPQPLSVVPNTESTNLAVVDPTTLVIVPIVVAALSLFGFRVLRTRRPRFAWALIVVFGVELLTLTLLPLLPSSG